MKVRGLPANKICLPAGFSFSAACAGIKASGRPDLALVEAVPGTTAAAMFTKNRVVAAPLDVGRASLAASRGRVRAVIVNSGNANCATGDRGYGPASEVCRELARILGCTPQQNSFLRPPASSAFLCRSKRSFRRLPELAAGAHGTSRPSRASPSAIMTTDTRPKLAGASFRSGKASVNLLGIAKGAGMIHPQLATMLVYLFTDIVAPLQLELKHGSTGCVRRQTFNCISIDGDTSTNDTVLLLASGQSGVQLERPQPSETIFHSAAAGLPVAGGADCLRR